MAANNYFDWAVSLYRFIKRDTARAEEVNSALDEISNGFTAVETKTNAALKLPDGETATTFATAATRKGKLVSFNATTGAVEATISTVDVSTVAAIATDVTTVSGIAADVPTVAGISGNVTTVATIAADVPTVAGISGNVTTVATNNANVSTVATNISNVGTVAGISANVTTVAGISGNVTTVAANDAAVSTCAANIAAIIAAPDYAAALQGTSTTSLAIGTGAKTFVTQTGKQFAAGQYVIAVSDADAANYMFGTVTSYAGTSLELNVIAIGGSGTLADWTINMSGARGAAGAAGVATDLTPGTASALQLLRVNTAGTAIEGYTFSANTQWTTITADPAPAVVGSSYQCNTTSAAFTVTLPAAPAANDLVRIADYAGTFATNNLTIGRNALNIMGLAEDMVISTNNVSLTLQYIDASRGWALV